MRDTQVSLTDYTVDVRAETDIGDMAAIVLNNFKPMFRQQFREVFDQHLADATGFALRSIYDSDVLVTDSASEPLIDPI